MIPILRGGFVAVVAGLVGAFLAWLQSRWAERTRSKDREWDEGHHKAQRDADRQERGDEWERGRRQRADMLNINLKVGGPERVECHNRLVLRSKTSGHPLFRKRQQMRTYRATAEEQAEFKAAAEPFRAAINALGISIQKLRMAGLDNSPT